MKKQTLTMDINGTLVDIVAEGGGNRDAVFITAYTNGLSLRSSTLQHPSARDRFVRCVWVMAGADNAGFSVIHDHTMRDWITEQATGGSGQ